MQIVDIKLGSEGELKIDLAAGIVTVELDEKTAGLDGGLKLNIPSDYYVDAIAAKYTWLAPFAAMAKGVLKGMP
jgi:hypothetical protein